MSQRFKILAINGSTRAGSSNLSLLKTIKDLFKENFDLEIFSSIQELPHFNPDHDQAEPPGLIREFREKIKSCDGVLICTPEYAMGVPGTLKNAIDWTVSSMTFSQKPTALITASLSGEKGHRSLLETLLIIEARISVDSQLVIPYIKTKINSEGQITDEMTASQIKKVMDSFCMLLKRENVILLDETFLNLKSK